MHTLQFVLLIVGALIAFLVVGDLVGRFYRMRVRDRRHLEGILGTLINFSGDGATLTVFSPNSTGTMRFEKSSDLEGDYCQLVFPEGGEIPGRMTVVEEALRRANIAFTIVSALTSNPRSSKVRELISEPIRTPSEAAKAAGIVFHALGIDPDRGLRFKSEGRSDPGKAFRRLREELGPRWWIPR